MFCPDCGNELREPYMFCGRCGAKVRETIDVISEPYNQTPGNVSHDKFDETISIATNVAFASGAETIKSPGHCTENMVLSENLPINSQPAQKNGKSKAMMIVIIVIILVLVVAVSVIATLFITGTIGDEKSDTGSVTDTYKDSENDGNSDENRVTGDNNISGDNSKDETTSAFAGVKVGDVIELGTYEQDNYVSNGKEKIEWIVLDKSDGKILVVSKYGLDCKSYNTENKNVTWESCTLRTWLNGTFFNGAFLENEKNVILTTTVVAEDNATYNTDAGNSTQDKVFLLSASEANKYFSSDVKRQCTPTAYAKVRGTYVNPDIGTTWWWLRSPGYDQSSAADVYSVGNIYDGGCTVNGNDGAVRPAMWIDLNS